MIVIESKKDGFRRCGIAHPTVPVSYPDDRFTTEELDALQAEPMLIVIVAEEAEAVDEKDKAPNQSKGKTKNKPDADKE